MTRRLGGRPVHGWLILDKPVGVTSAQAVAKAKWAFDARKAGHAGTLDPAATGVLAVAFGEATKTVPFVIDALKAYRFTVHWGTATLTDDAEGEVIATSAARPTAAAIRAALSRFTGLIEQIPPQVSAVKVNGIRAYARVRAGESPDLAARPLHVDALRLIEVPDPDTAVLEMVCGKGGYVRSIARDLGMYLGVFGHVTALRRISSGPFEGNRAIAWHVIEDMARTPAIDAHLLPMTLGLRSLPECRVTGDVAARLRNGNAGPVSAPGAARYGDLAWASCDGDPVAIGTYRAGELHPTRVFRFETA